MSGPKQNRRGDCAECGRDMRVRLDDHPYEHNFRRGRCRGIFRRALNIHEAPGPIPRPLRCPYCGNKIEPNLVYTGSYSEHRDLESLECENFKCNAKWTGFGEPKELPHEYGQPAASLQAEQLKSPRPCR